MKAPKDSPEQKYQLWTQRIADWHTSGLSQQIFCDQKQLNYSTFVYWRGRLKQDKNNNKKKNKVNFLPVSLTQDNDSTLTLKINGEHSIMISQGFDPDLLRNIIQAVQTAT